MRLAIAVATCCSRALSRVAQGCSRALSRVAQGCSRALSRVAQGCSRALSRVAQGCPRALSRVAQGCPRALSRVAQGCLYAAATMATSAVAEVDPCERDADVDAQMACYVARYCTEVGTDAERADCYSKVIRTLLAPPTVSPPAASAPDDPATSPNAQGDIPQEVRAHVSGIVPRAYGLRFIKLDNDQVWEQIESSRSRLETGDAVRIMRGRFNSYRLFPPNGGMLRVRPLICDADADEDTLAKCRSLQRADG